ASWWALALGAATMAVAFMVRGPAGLSSARPEASVGDLALSLPVVPFLAAALLRLGGQPVAVRRLRLLLDGLILGIAPALAGLAAVARAAEQAWPGQAPMEGTFWAALPLPSVLALRQMVTLVDNRRLLKSAATAGAAEERPRDLGQGRTSSLEEQHVVRTL